MRARGLKLRARKNIFYVIYGAAFYVIYGAAAK